jgi:large subunit ribosomal protein L4
MEAITLPIYNTEGKEIDTVKLNSRVFDGQVNSAAIHQVVTAYRANQRKGLAATKTRGEVSGGGKKPWKQKGTGRARVGSTRSPLWRHGGVVFGPHPRNFSYSVPQKIRALALRSSLNAKAMENNLIVLDGLKLEKQKTKDVSKVFSNLKVLPKDKNKQRLLLLLEKMNDGFKFSARNLSFLNIGQAIDTHAYEVMSHSKVIITKEGLTQLTNRLK